MSISLTSDQKAFLEECSLEFSDRFTDSDPDYKKVYDEGVPPPPIVCPWYGRSTTGGNWNNRNREQRDGGFRDNRQFGRGNHREDRKRSWRDRGDHDNDEWEKDRRRDVESNSKSFRPY